MQKLPDWLKVPYNRQAVEEVAGLMKDLKLNTVCKEANCPNLGECYQKHTATFMIMGSECTRNCRFCNVTCGKAGPLDPEEPLHVAEVAQKLGLRHVVVTQVTRDDLPDGGAAHFAATIREIRARLPGTTVEVLVPDFQGDAGALDLVLAAQPDIFNHNLETVARLQRIARPSAGYARSLAVLGRAAAAGLVTKSGLVLGMGETKAEISQALGDLAAVGVSIVTMGQYLRPSRDHLPIANYWTPEDFAEFAEMAQRAGIVHAESSPFTRSSHHAGTAYDALVEIPVSIGSTTVR